MPQTRDEIFKQIGEVVRICFPDYDGSVTPETTAEDVPGWDSAAHVGFIVEVEDKFGIEIDPNDYIFNDIGALTTTVQSYLR